MLRRLTRVAVSAIVVLLVSAGGTPASAQNVPTTPDETEVTVQYSRCLQPTDPTDAVRLAFTEADKRDLHCERWASFQAVRRDLGAAMASSEDGAPMNRFLAYLVREVYLTETPSTHIGDVYANFRNWGWQSVDRLQRKAGALIVWPSAVGMVIADASTPQERAKNPLAGLTVLYPKGTSGELKILRADKFMDPVKDPKPRFVVPVAPKTIFWNTWVERESGAMVDDAIVSSADGPRTFKVFLDLARFDYARVGSPDPGPASGAGAAYLRKIAGDNVEIRVMATPVGSGVSVVDSGLIRRLIRDNFLDAVGRDGRRPGEPLSALSRVATGLVDPEAASDTDRGRIAVKIEARKAGCAGVAFSIWNAAMTRLLDYIVRPVTVKGEGDEEQPPCGATPQVIAMGPDSARLAFAGASSDDADATLQVFEKTGATDGFTVVAYAEQGGLVASWAVGPSVTEFENHLSTQVNKETGSSAGYVSRMGLIVRRDLFTPTDKRDNEQAKTALEQIRALARQEGTLRPRLRVRVSNTFNAYVPLPVHLLTISDDDGAQSISTKVDILYEMPIPAVLGSSKDNRCISSWTIAVPADLARDLVDLPTDPAAPDQAPDAGSIAKALGPPLNATIVTEWKPFLGYLNGGTKKTSDPEAFVLIAHHGNDSLGFAEKQLAPFATAEDIRRPYPAGSLAVLAACSVAATSGNARGILARLNANGVTAAVVSPFLVPNVVGAKLTLSLTRRVIAAQQTGAELDARTLFNDAVLEVLKNENKALSDPEQERVLDFILVGDATVRVCK